MPGWAFSASTLHCTNQSTLPAWSLAAPAGVDEEPRQMGSAGHVQGRILVWHWCPQQRIIWLSNHAGALAAYKHVHAGCRLASVSCYKRTGMYRPIACMLAAA